MWKAEVEVMVRLIQWKTLKILSVVILEFQTVALTQCFVNESMQCCPCSEVNSHSANHTVAPRTVRVFRRACHWSLS
jgi:hypothetical protein